MALSYSKKLSELLRGIMSKHHGNFYCISSFHSFAKENKHETHKKVCENKVFCNIAMLSQNTKILEFNQFLIFDIWLIFDISCKSPFIIYAILNV